MAQGSVNVTLGCDYLKDNGHIDIHTEAFAALTEERLIRVHKGVFLPARNNTACIKRQNGKCDVNCRRAITVYQVGHHWSPQQKAKRM